MLSAGASVQAVTTRPVPAVKRAIVCAATCALISGLPLQASGLELRQAERSGVAGEPARPVALPDGLTAGAGQAGPLTAHYRLRAELGPRSGTTALYLPGLIAHARIRVNGHVLFDTLEERTQPLPRSAERIQLLRLPDEFVNEGANEIAIEAAGAHYLSVSPVWIGGMAELEHLYDERLLGAVIGPAIVATVMGCLALCVLLLWARRPTQRLYGYFGTGALCWALHSAWTVLPAPLLYGVHLGVWWTSMYSAFVVLLVIFCVRFAGWHWPRFDRALWAMGLAAPAVLYGAAALGRLGEAAEAWRLACIAIVLVGVIAVGLHAWRRRDVASVLLLASGAVSLAFGLRDWEVAHRGSDNNPVYLTPYAGLLFIALVAWMLIDGFVHATQALERANAGLEERVAHNSEALRIALEDMRAARDLAQAADRAKSRFLAAASHDLRQPVHALGLYLATIAPGAVPEAVRDTLARMGSSLRALGAMFDALLDVSRMDAGVVAPRPEPFDLDALMRRLGDEFAPLAEGKGLRLLLHGDPRASAQRALADPFLVERIVRNLLSNAVKYTHAGGVLLAWRWRAACGPGWRIEVRDSGTGIDPALQSRVFDEFVQGSPSAAAGGDGLGLGLSIVRRLTHLMGLVLDMQSVPGRGTRFRLGLPATAEAARPATTQAEPALAPGAWICLVEDDVVVLAAMRRLLEHWGCHVIEGTGAPQALRDWRLAGCPALAAIVADLQLGAEDGLEAVRYLRGVFDQPTLAAMLVTGDASPDRIARLNGSGVPWLAKPVPAARLRRWLTHVAAARPLESP